FIAAAELYNRITDIDQWVVGSVFDWLEENQTKIRDIDGLSINISGNSMSDKLFMDYLYDRLTSGNFNPHFITFEVTETSAIDDIDYAIFFINKLKTTGCRFSLDDFGTGLSSYAYLRKLPVDYLKIDGVFVKNIDTNEDDMAVVCSISEIAHVMGKKVIAEFVANEQVLEKLQGTDIEFGQGYAIEKPITLDQLLR
ncbi:MAG: EAL domain-containing protein, partial [Chromatiales bacterium]|nr:EAL domain-containing protein [Chromatiales bacterium]